MPDASGIDITATVADSMPASYADTGARGVGVGGGGVMAAAWCAAYRVVNYRQTAADVPQGQQGALGGGSVVLLLFPATCCGRDVLEVSVKYMT
jgi:hypothetical protein